MRRALAGLLTAGAVAAAATAVAPAVAAAELSGGRVYELVSPWQSRGVDYEYAWAWGDGDTAAFASLNDVPGLTLGYRTDTGWRQDRVELLPPDARLDLRHFLVDDEPSGARMLVKYTTRDPANGVSLALLEDGDWRVVGDNLAYVGGSTDLSRLVVERSSDAAVPFPGVTSRTGVFLWEDGEVTPIGDDDSRAAACGADAAGVGRNDVTYLESSTTWRGATGGGQRGVSDDAGTVVLVTRRCTSGGTTLEPHVLVSRDGETVDVSAPIAGADAAARFAGNALDGSTVYFTTAAQLESDDVNGVADLYRYDVGDGSLTRVSAGATDGGSPSGVTVAYPAREGGAAWFVTGDSTATTLWVWGEGGPAEQIATGNGTAFDLQTSYLDRYGSNYDKQSQVTPDGYALAWISRAPLGGSPGGSDQLLRATADGEVVCVSCPRAGASASGVGLGQSLDYMTVPLDRMTPDGETIAFETTTAIDPADGNGKYDVYVWESGTLSLISSGTHGRGAFLAGVSPYGDVFFRDGAALVPGVEDDRFHVYAARVDGGFPAPPQRCSGDGCQGEPRAPEVTPGPSGSETQNGPEDVDDPVARWAADPAVTLTKLSTQAKRKLAAGRAVKLVVRSTAAGRVTAQVRYRVGKRWVRSSGAARTVKAAGRTTLTLRLSRAARKRLAAKGALRVRIEVDHGAGVRTAATAFVLKTKVRRGAHA
jgi:hypothetical protein